MESEKTQAVAWPEEPFIRVIYAEKGQEAESETLSSVLNENEAKPIAVTEYHEPPPDRLGGTEIIVQLVISYLSEAALRLAFSYLRKALMAYAKKHKKDSTRSLIIRLLEEKSGRRRDLGLEANQINKNELDRLEDASQEILKAWLQG
jgi:hypothetical protein